jgi:acetyl-CoA carboxylase alpha subunit|tara:strand:- start:138 stop:395 length:258 start_codon:yes stop_codon:yes gene_type:complete
MEKLLIQEWGIVGVMLAILWILIAFLQKTLMKKLTETDDKVVALINRWNRSDEARDRRHEQLLDQINRITDDQNFIKGRLNGKGR